MCNYLGCRSDFAKIVVVLQFCGSSPAKRAEAIAQQSWRALWSSDNYSPNQPIN